MPLCPQRKLIGYGIYEKEVQLKKKKLHVGGRQDVFAGFQRQKLRDAATLQG